MLLDCARPEARLLSLVLVRALLVGCLTWPSWSAGPARRTGTLRPHGLTRPRLLLRPGPPALRKCIGEREAERSRHGTRDCEQSDGPLGAVALPRSIC